MPLQSPDQFKMPLRSLDQFKPGVCVNCGATTMKGKLYCSQWCAQLVELIRWMRRKVANGTENRPDIVEAFRNRSGILISGDHYDRENRKESQATKEALRKRSRGRCEKCGRTFGDDGDSRFTVQHTAKGEKLAWCWRCNMDDAQARLQPISDANRGAKKRANELGKRIWSPKPLYFVDDPEAWTKNYRGLMRIAHIPDAGIALSVAHFDLDADEDRCPNCDPVDDNCSPRPPLDDEEWEQVIRRAQHDIVGDDEVRSEGEGCTASWYAPRPIEIYDPVKLRAIAVPYAVARYGARSRESVRLRSAEIMSEIDAALDRARTELTKLKPRRRPYKLKDMGTPYWAEDLDIWEPEDEAYLHMVMSRVD